MDLDALFGDGKNGDVDTLDADAEAQEFEDVPEEQREGVGGIGWKMLVLFVGGGLLVTALAVAFTVWVINALIL
ncbi:hypothetical protein [Lentzea sp.]|uniref:hypothetical protein n=1 Tax=Lentzea sp. TaxID=56099 RepID=UPI002ED5006E